MITAMFVGGLIVAIFGQQLGKYLILQIWPFCTTAQLLIMADHYANLQLPFSIKSLNGYTKGVLEGDAMPKKQITKVVQQNIPWTIFLAFNILMVLAIAGYSYAKIMKK